MANVRPEASTMHASKHKRHFHTRAATVTSLALAAAVSGSPALAAAQVGDAGRPDGALRAGYFDDETGSRLPAPRCESSGDPEAAGCYTNFLVLSDLDGDGDMDIVYANGG